MNGKRKGTTKKIFLLIISVVAAVFFCTQIYYFVDYSMNGRVLDWFDENYMRQYDLELSEEEKEAGAGGKVIIREPAWGAVKELCFVVFCVGTAGIVILVYVVSWLYADGKVKQSMADTNRMIRLYMMDGVAAKDVFLEKDIELYAQMVEIKSTMQKHEQTLKEEAARKNDLIVYLAHDLKTPLTSVIGYLSLLQEVPEMPAEQRARYIGITLDKAQRLEQLINEFFDITRYNLQQIHLERESINLTYMLMQLTDEFYPILNAHGNTIRLQTDEELTVYGDAEKLARVFNNILKNAVAYSYPDTEITVRAEEREQEVHIFFCNKGKTISPHKLEAIFEKFFRLDEARSANTGGAGLGLAIAKEIVTIHGGSIIASSEDELTTFHIVLPSAGFTKNQSPVNGFLGND